ncbi:MAG: iron-sulfur cluster assembly accessory protein [Myxococcota bacterium]
MSTSTPKERAETRPDPTPSPTDWRFELTPEAARKLYEALKKRGTLGAALRVGVKGGGCSGFSYVLEFTDKPPMSRDLVFEFEVEQKEGDEEAPDPVRVFCDKKSIIYLNGTTLAWQKTLMYRGFQFVNPKEKSSCGCNESFAV